MKLLLLCCLAFLASADMYMQSVRGSNNRLDEANRERNNGNRMFNSQNNDRGGYNVGKLNFYEGEEVPFSWTMQHGCGGDPTQDCEINIQMMCDPLIRDGTTTSTIPINDLNCINFDCDSDPKYGRHESVEYYRTCKKSERNKGLFTANQNLKGDDATKTRQNPGGTRRGLECEEERDYYPYWKPSPWADLALFTNKPERCAEYKKESENVKGKTFCELTPNLLKYWNGLIPLEKEKCDDVKMLKSVIEQKRSEEKARLRAGRRALLGEDFNTNYEKFLLEDLMERRRLNDQNDQNQTEPVVAPDLYERASWKTSTPHGWPAPECYSSPLSRPNHLGLVGQKTQASWKFTVPKILDPAINETQARCVMRIRYNITQDIGGWDSATTLGAGVDYKANQNRTRNPNPGNDPSWLPIWETYGIPYEEVKSQFDQGANGKDASREYVFINNPNVNFLGNLAASNLNVADNFEVKTQLAINTAQYGRTFQDRSHAMYINAVPEDLKDKKIKLVTVSGKRGNIVQTFPGHEYFMIPETLHIKQGEYAHFEWTGSNTNPNNNDGQGKQGTDRSNIVASAEMNYEKGETIDQNQLFSGSLLNNYPAYTQFPASGLPNPDLHNCGANPRSVVKPMAGFTQDFVNQLATGRRNHAEKLDMGNMEELDDAATSFAAYPQQVKELGCWAYVSTRNNNFSNRSQKGSICVGEGDFDTDNIDGTGKDIMTETGGVAVGSGVLKETVSMSVRTWPDKDAKSNGAVSNILELSPTNLEPYMKDGESMDIELPFQKKSMMKQTMYWRQTSEDDWEEVDAEFRLENGVYTAVNHGRTGGQYEVQESADPGAVIAVLLGSFAIIGAAAYVCYRKQFNLGTKEVDPHFDDRGTHLNTL